MSMDRYWFNIDRSNTK